MKESGYKNEFEEINGVSKSDIEGIVSMKMIYPEFRVVLVTIDGELKLLIEVHVAELGEDSYFFSVTTDGSNITEEHYKELLHPMIYRLNKDILHEILKALPQEES